MLRGLAGIEPTPARPNGAGYACLNLSATAGIVACAWCVQSPDIWTEQNAPMYIVLLCWVLCYCAEYCSIALNIGPRRAEALRTGQGRGGTGRRLAGPRPCPVPPRRRRGRRVGPLRTGPGRAGPDRDPVEPICCAWRALIDKYTGLQRMGNREPNRRDLSGQRRHFQGIVDAIVLYCWCYCFKHCSYCDALFWHCFKHFRLLLHCYQYCSSVIVAFLILLLRILLYC
jgi:hypothetical protein